MRKILSALLLFVLSNSIHAAAITDLTITGGNFDLGGAGGEIFPAAFAEMTVGGYDGAIPTVTSSELNYAATSIATFTFGFFGPVAIYTSESDNINSGFAPVTGDITGSTLTLDLSSWTMYHGGNSFNQGGIITTTIDLNGNFTASWNAVFIGGAFDGQIASWTITGNAAVSPVPVPAAVWLFISGLAGMVIPGVVRRRKIEIAR